MNINKQILSNISEIENRKRFYELYSINPLPEDEVLTNLGLFINRQTLSRIIFMNELYQKIVNVHGVVMEFGVRWGQNLALFESFRGMYEPFNFTRKIIGFDTFEGFPTIHEKDGNLNKINDYSVTDGYEKYLEKILQYHENESPISHIKKFELIKGDATKTLAKYLEKNPETLIAFAYFDFDLYEPTKACLQLIKDRLVKGSIIGFDELNHPKFPGETLAFMEVLGANNYTLHRSILSPYMSYVIIR
ncbi:crotonobetainyl-CoA--carnitine CoA-transferase [Sporosarcina sp. 179-K 3D1 HS]|uniref:crotonobetainyl-CoA--carnitine CoA-transferase n=1 Tax=Sporosarcina sp. 179-K 3D1 HS TaxID=3232169 RepID=UPI0039A2992B